MRARPRVEAVRAARLVGVTRTTNKERASENHERYNQPDLTMRVLLISHKWS